VVKSLEFPFIDFLGPFVFIFHSLEVLSRIDDLLDKVGSSAIRDCEELLHRVVVRKKVVWN